MAPSVKHLRNTTGALYAPPLKSASARALWLVVDVSGICRNICHCGYVVNLEEEPYLVALIMFSFPGTEKAYVLCTHAFSTRSLADLGCTPVHYMYLTCTRYLLS